MKIKIDSIGFGDVKNIQVGEKMIRNGLIIAFVGLTAITIGSIIIKKTSWISGSNQNQIEYIQNIFREFDSACS